VVAMGHLPFDRAVPDCAAGQDCGLKLAATDASQAVQPTVKHVIGPYGGCLTLADLPSSATKRWVPARKAEVVAAVRGGLLSEQEACSRYALNFDEFQSWQQCVDRFGLAGLRTTRSRSYLRKLARLEGQLGSTRRSG
jgi:hypothetical protein